MDYREKITEAIYDAIGEVNRSLKLKEPLQPAPETVLIGDGAKLDSLGLVTFVAALEERLDRVLEDTLSVMDLLEPEGWTVSSLTRQIERAVPFGTPTPDQVVQ